MNNVVLVGRLTKDPELRTTQSDISVCSFSLAVKRDVKKDDGSYDADFIDCVLYRQSAEYLHNYAKKGATITLRGRIQKRSWEDSEGNTRYITEVVGDKVSIISSPSGAKEEKKEESSELNGINEIVLTDDDLPF